MKVSAKHIEDFKFEMISDSLSITSDQAEQYGGEGKGPMPSELILWALASCMGQSIVHIAGKMRVAVKGLTLVAEGRKDVKEFKYDQMTLQVSSESPSPKELEKMVKLARKYCFVSNTLSQGITIDYMVKS